jgi:hypothetical protein
LDPVPVAPAAIVENVFDNSSKNETFKAVLDDDVVDVVALATRLGEKAPTNAMDDDDDDDDDDLTAACLETEHRSNVMILTMRATQVLERLGILSCCASTSYLLLQVIMSVSSAAAVL